jgi:hypothetical protein
VHRRSGPDLRRCLTPFRRSLCMRCRRCTARAGSAAETLLPQRIPGRSAVDCGRRTADRAGPAAAGSATPPRYRASDPAARPISTAAGEDGSPRRPQQGVELIPASGLKVRAFRGERYPSSRRTDQAVGRASRGRPRHHKPADAQHQGRAIGDRDSVGDHRAASSGRSTSRMSPKETLNSGPTTPTKLGMIPRSGPDASMRPDALRVATESGSIRLRPRQG